MNVNDARDIRHVTSSNMKLTHAALQVSVMFNNVQFLANSIVPNPMHINTYEAISKCRKTFDAESEKKKIISSHAAVMRTQEITSTRSDIICEWRSGLGANETF